MSNVILVGYMGSGKSTVGKKLSYRLREPFLDTDKQIELKQKCTINEIFESLGEEAFREMETQYLRDLLEESCEYVIAVGGGLVLREVNRELLKELGTVVYLRAKPETIYERLKGDTTRPLLQCENPKEKIEQMIEQRHPVYMSCADVVIDVDDKDFTEILKDICHCLDDK